MKHTDNPTHTSNNKTTKKKAQSWKMSQTITARKKKHKNFFVLSDIFKVYGHISRLTLQAPPPLISDRTITKKKKELKKTVLLSSRRY